MPDHRERILELARVSPLLPMQVAKALGVDSIMASAMLSELVSKNELKISSVKVGSSPLYYNPKHPEHLVPFVKNLNEKEQCAVNELKEKVVLREKTLDPLTRVCLRNAKDYAFPLEVQWEGETELFWKWYLASDEDAEERIKEQFSKSRQSSEPEHDIKPEKKPVKKKIVRKKKVVTMTPAQKSIEETAAPKDKKVKKEKKQDEYSVADPFAKKLEDFFKDNKIKIIERLESKKNDFSFIVEVPSQVGDIQHYCRARKKAKISDAEIGQALLHGQLRQLPVLFIGDGELTKPAENVIPDLKGVSVKLL